MILKTPLYEAHRKQGARLVDFAGWDMPVQYAGVLDECRAVRTGVGLFDVSHMGRIRVTGKGALAYLQYLTVSNVADLDPAGGRAQYSLLCNEDGGILDDIIIYRLAADEFIVVVNASNRDKDWAWMRRHAAGRPDLVLEDETLQTALIAVQGPQAISFVDALSDREVACLPRYGLDESVVADVQTLVARTGYTGEDGVEIFCRAEEARGLWQEFVDKGGIPCGLGARDTLRLEAAMPLYGHEMDEEVHPYEARLGWAVKTDKPDDFLGKAALQAVKAAPRRRTLVGIEMDDRAIPRSGYAVACPDTGDEIGVVTSGTFSPVRGKGIALARVEGTGCSAGTPVSVVVRGTPHPAHTVKLPFYKKAV